MSSTYHESHSDKVTVVIATLGGASLKGTIDALNRGSIIPDEILVCIPENEARNVRKIICHNVSTIVTECRGQVAQRVMQLDDDILLSEDAVELMVTSLLSLGRGHVVAPVYYNSVTGEPLTKIESGVRGFGISLYETIVRGLPWGKKRIGALSSIGACGGVDPRMCKEDIYPTDWLPGGCVLSYREDLLVECFFPLAGKAYSEDVLHSHLRRQQGLCHHVVCLAKASIEPPERCVSVMDARGEIAARMHVARVLGGGAIRAFVAALLDIARRQVVHMFR